MQNEEECVRSKLNANLSPSLSKNLLKGILKYEVIIKFKAYTFENSLIFAFHPLIHGKSKSKLNLNKFQNFRLAV